MEGLDRGARPVHRQLQSAGGAGQRLAPPGDLLRQTLPLELLHCHSAKSAYWIGSSGSGDGSPAEKAS